MISNEQLMDNVRAYVYIDNGTYDAYIKKFWDRVDSYVDEQDYIDRIKFVSFCVDTVDGEKRL